jgi:hypothetical protein
VRAIQETTMSEHTLSAVLTFALMAGGAAAIGSEMFTSRPTPKAQPALQVVTLPQVTVTGQRPKTVKVAADSSSVPAQRVQ